MSLKQQIDTDIKNAMKAKNKGGSFKHCALLNL